MGKISVEIPEQLAADARRLTGKRTVAAALAAVVAQQAQIEDGKARLAARLAASDKRNKGKGDRRFPDAKSAIAFIRSL